MHIKGGLNGCVGAFAGSFPTSEPHTTRAKPLPVDSESATQEPAPRATSHVTCTEFSNCLETGKMNRASCAILNDAHPSVGSVHRRVRMIFRGGSRKGFYFLPCHLIFCVPYMYYFYNQKNNPGALHGEDFPSTHGLTGSRSRSRAQGWRLKAPLPSQNLRARVHMEQGPSSGPCHG